MPKHTLTFETEDKIPAELKPLAKGLTVEFWSNTDDLALAAELNPTLEAHKNTILSEKRTLEGQYNALKQVSTDKEIDAAKIVLENETLKRSAKTTEESELLTSIQQIFNNAPVSEVKTKLPTLLEDSKFAAQARKNQEYEKLFEVSGYKNKKVFIDQLNNPAALEGVEGLPIAETVEGTDKKALFVQIKDANGVLQKKRFDEYAKTNEVWTTYAPALMNGQPQDGQTWVKTGSETDDKGNPKKTAAQTYTEKHNEAQKTFKNPFAPESVPQTPQGQGLPNI